MPSTKQLQQNSTSTTRVKAGKFASYLLCKPLSLFINVAFLTLLCGQMFIWHSAQEAHAQGWHDSIDHYQVSSAELINAGTIPAKQNPLKTIWYENEEALRAAASLVAIGISVCALLVSYFSFIDKKRREQRQELHGLIERIRDLRMDYEFKLIAPLSEQEKDFIGAAFHTKRLFYLESAGYIAKRISKVSAGEFLVLGSEHFLDVNYVEAEMFLKMAVVASRRSSVNNQAITLRGLARILYYAKQPKEGSKHYENSVRLSSKQRDPYSDYTTAYTYRDWAASEFFAGSFDEARSLTREALATAQRLPDTGLAKASEIRHCGRSFAALGIKSMESGSLERERKNFGGALEVIKNLGDDYSLEVRGQICLDWSIQERVNNAASRAVSLLAKARSHFEMLPGDYPNRQQCFVRLTREEQAAGVVKE